MKRQIIIVDGYSLHIEMGHNKTEWKDAYGRVEENWHFLIEELLDGTIDINEDIWYWLINGRLYETDIEVTGDEVE